MTTQDSIAMKLFWKALLWATIIELIVLALTVLPMLRSFMSHSAADSNSFSNNFLARVGIYFHFPSFLIVTPFGGFLFSPLIQILLMDALLYFAFVSKLKRKSSQGALYQIV